MANVTIASTPTTVTISLNDYSPIYGVKTIKARKENIGVSWIDEGDYVEFSFKTGILSLSYDNTTFYVIDSIDGVAPTSTEDLVEKLESLM